MALLLDKNGNGKEVSPEDVQSYLSQGYAFSPDQPVTVETIEGDFGTMDALEANDFLSDPNSGYRYVSPEKVNEIRVRDKHDNLEGQLKATAEGTARALTFGASDLALEALGADPQDIEDRKILGGSTVGEAAAFVAPWEKAGRLGKLAGAGIKGLDKVSRKAAEKVATKAFKSKIGKGVARGATQGAIEGGLYEGAQGISEQMLGDAEFNGQAVIARSKNGIKYGAGLGGLFGGVGGAVSKVIDSDKRIIKKLNSLKDEKVIPSDRRMINTPLQKGIMSNIPTLRGTYSDEVGGYVFPVGPKGKTTIEISENLEGLNVLDMNDKSALIDFADDAGVPKLIEHLKYDKASNPESLISAAIGRVQQTAKADVLKKFSTSSQRIQKLKAEAVNVKAGWNRLLKKRNRTTADNRKIGKLRASYETKRKQIIELSKVKKLDREDIYKNVSKGRGIKELKKYDAIKLGDDLYVINNAKLDDYNVGAYIEKPKKKSKTPESDKAALKAYGAIQSTLNKLEKKGPDVIRNTAKYAKRLIDDTPFFSSLDDVAEKVSADRVRSFDAMDNAIDTQMAYFQRHELDPRVNYGQFADYIVEKVLPKMEDYDGLPSIATKPLWERMSAQAKKYRKFQSMLEDEVTMGQRQYASLNLAELRSERMKLDSALKHDRQSGNFTTDEMYKNIRREMEDVVENASKNFEELSESRAAYKKGKQDYIDTLNMELVLDRGIKAQEGNNKVGLTSYISGGAGAGMLGAIDPSLAIAGAAIGTAGREATRKYGDKFLAIYGDRVRSSAMGVKKTIKRSAKAFLDAPSSKLVLPSVAVFTPRELELRNLSDYQNYVYDIQPMLKNFEEKNEYYSEYLPETAAATRSTMLRGMKFLNGKMPKNPYGTNYFKQHTPPEMEMRKFERYKNAVANPLNSIKEIESGYASPEGIEVLKEVYPSIYENLKMEFLEQLNGAKPDYRKRLQINKMFGIETDYYLQPQNIQMLQQSARLMNEEEEQTSANMQNAGKINKSERAATDAQKTTAF